MGFPLSNPWYFNFAYSFWFIGVIITTIWYVRWWYLRRVYEKFDFFTYISTIVYSFAMVNLVVVWIWWIENPWRDSIQQTDFWKYLVSLYTTYIFFVPSWRFWFVMTCWFIVQAIVYGVVTHHFVLKTKANKRIIFLGWIVLLVSDFVDIYFTIHCLGQFGYFIYK